LLTGYAVSSYGYRWVVCGLIVLWCGSYSFWLGMLAGAFVGFIMLVKPVARAVEFLRRAPQLARQRTRAYAVAGSIGAAVLIVLFALPVPFHTTVEGVVWLPEDARIRADTGGFVTEIMVADGQPVKAGQQLLVLTDPELHSRHAAAAARAQALEIEYTRAMGVDTPLAHSLEQSLSAARSELDDLQRQLDSLSVLSPVEGTLVLPRPQDLPGSYVARGDVLAHVLRAEDISVKVAVPQADAGLIRSDTRDVEVKLIDHTNETQTAHLTGEMPAATAVLPTAALGTRSGGSVPVDPADVEGLRTLEPVFLIDLKLDARRLERVGGRAWVRFNHGVRPIGVQWQRRLHQLFLKQFNPTA
jgi:putative peptide zinc metalloprotease protein